MWANLIATLGGGVGGYFIKRYFDKKKQSKDEERERMWREQQRKAEQEAEAKLSEEERLIKSLEYSQKVIFTGAAGAGKHTLIKLLSDEDSKVQNTENLELREAYLRFGDKKGFYPFNPLIHSIIPMPTRPLKLIKIKAGAEKMAESLLQSGDMLVYVFDSTNFTMDEKTTFEIGRLQALAQAKGAKLKLIGTRGGALERVQKEALIKSIQSIDEGLEIGIFELVREDDGADEATKESEESAGSGDLKESADERNLRDEDSGADKGDEARERDKTGGAKDESKSADLSDILKEVFGDGFNKGRDFGGFASGQDENSGANSNTNSSTHFSINSSARKELLDFLKLVSKPRFRGCCDPFF